MFATQQFLFPATKALLDGPELRRPEAGLLRRPAGQPALRRHQRHRVPEFQWPPFLDQAATDWTETVGKSFADKSDTVAALEQWQSRLTTYAKNQGFTVK